ncbi:tetratricopeptide repeat protein [Streptomyces chartreusis]|uniref:tetratricopeptide repeat protein n=1 Tax=Streptomyces chartreusis TaxID=1969 RepID=UPI003629085A
MTNVTVYGPSVQARSISELHFHADQFTPPTPRQLLPVPAVWTDRTYDLVQLTAAVDRMSPESVRVIAISGPSGIGKTAVATKFLHAQSERFPGGALYADLRGYAPGGRASTPEVLTRLLRSVRPGVRATTADELGAWWRTATADPARPVCVLLDNAVDADQVRALLPGGPGHVVVTTSRTVLGGLAAHGARFHTVGPLDDEAAQEYLVRCLGRDRIAGDHRAAARIVRLSAGRPMALAVVVGALASRTDQSMAAVTADLMSTRSTVRLTHPALTRQEAAVPAALAGQYDYLSFQAAAVYRRLGSLPVLDVDTALAAAVAGLTWQTAGDALNTLLSAGMIEPVQTADDGSVRGRVFQFHDSAREHAAQVFAQEEPTDPDNVLRRALDCYLDTATRAERRLTRTHRPLARDYLHQPAEPVTFDTDTAALAWLEAAQPSLDAAITAAAAAGLDSSVWQLTHALWPLLRAHHDYDLWDRTHALALRSARSCQDSLAELEILGTWSVGLRSAGRHDDAIEAFDQVLSLARAAHDARGEAQALHELGATHLAAGRPEEAEPLLVLAYQQRAALVRSAAATGNTREQETFERAVAITDVCLGQVRLLLGRPPSDAVTLFSSARTTLLTLKDDIDAARALAWLGRAHALNGDLSKGGRFGRKAVAEFDLTGSHRWQARSRELLGQTLQAGGHHDDAAALYREALRIYTPISPPDADRVQERLNALSS